MCYYTIKEYERPKMINKIIPLISAVCLIALFTGNANASQFFRIGTGGTTGTYYPIGGLIANDISSPPGSRPCEQGGSCGVPGLIAIAQSSNGSVANINSISSGTLESGFVQADVAHWAYTGTGLFADKGKVANIRAIASLYPETVHIVASKDSGIKSVKDLKGHKVSLDEPGSGTLADAKLILNAYGLSETVLDAEYIKPSVAKIKDGLLDAFFIVAGYPTGAVVELAASVGVNLIPINGPEAEGLVNKYEFFTAGTIPAGTYENIGETKTINVGALWIVDAKVGDDLVYGITKALWNENTRKLLDSGHAKGKKITLATALDGIGIPLHPGAERFYREVGMLK